MTPTRGRWVALLSGVLSVLIGVAYLVLITVLDSRGPLLPPPAEAMGVSLSRDAAAVASPAGVSAAPPRG